MEPAGRGDPAALPIDPQHLVRQRDRIEEHQRASARKHVERTFVQRWWCGRQRRGASSIRGESRVQPRGRDLLKVRSEFRLNLLVERRRPCGVEGGRDELLLGSDMREDVERRHAVGQRAVEEDWTVASEPADL